jgi:hypothetical protein
MTLSNADKHTVSRRIFPGLNVTIISCFNVPMQAYNAKTELLLLECVPSLPPNARAKSKEHPRNGDQGNGNEAKQAGGPFCCQVIVH